MNKGPLIFIFLSFFIMLFIIPLINAQWAIQYDGWTADYARSIQQTSDGGFIVTGYTKSFGAGDMDFWVLKLSSIGDIEWQKTYGGSDSDYPQSIQQTSDGGFIVTGYTKSFGAGGMDFWVLKLSSIGDIEWQKAYGGSLGESAGSIQQTSDGGYIVGSYTGSFGAGGADFWILKLFSNGDIEWQKTYGGSDSDYAQSVRQTNDGGFIVTGYTDSFGAGDDDFWVLKLSSIGGIEWQKTYGGSDSDWASSIQQTADGGYIVAGGTRSFDVEECDFWVLKLSSTGDIEWQKAYGGSEFDRAFSIQQTADGGYIVAGRTDSFCDTEGDFWVLKLSSIGDIEWQKAYGGKTSVYGPFNDDEIAHSIQQTADSGYIVAGHTDSFGTSSGSGLSFLVLKLNSQGEIGSGCDIILNTDATITITSISPENTNIDPQDTSVVPLETSVISQDTDADIFLPCEVPLYTLEISHTSGGYTLPPSGTYKYYPLGVQSIFPTANQGYNFTGWTGDVPQGHEHDNPLYVSMTSNKSITANFQAAGGGGGGGEDGNDEDGGGGGGCFIATAIYESSLHPYVKTMRDFRDKYLMSNKLGRTFVKFYYKYSPYVANIITKNRPLKAIFRIHFLPVVIISYSMVHLGPIISVGILLFLVLFPVFFMSALRRK